MTTPMTHATDITATIELSMPPFTGIGVAVETGVVVETGVDSSFVVGGKRCGQYSLGKYIIMERYQISHFIDILDQEQAYLVQSRR